MSLNEGRIDPSPLPPCPHCGHHTTLFRPDEWVEGGPLECANPLCDTNVPPGRTS